MRLVLFNIHGDLAHEVTPPANDVAWQRTHLVEYRGTTYAMRGFVHGEDAVAYDEAHTTKLEG